MSTTAQQSSTTLAKVIKAGGVQMLPTVIPQTPPSSRPSTPLMGNPVKASFKKSSRIVPQTSTATDMSYVVDLEPLEPFEIATYEINTCMLINVVNFNIMCPDDLEPIRSQLKSIDGEQFTVTLFNTTDSKREIRISYIMT